MSRLRWGLLSTARINARLIPAIRGGARSDVTAVASRTLDRALAYAAEWTIARAVGSYEALLDDPDIDVIYIGLPNSLHVEWTVRALDAGKHVLCEKPLALSVADVDRIAAASLRAKRAVAEAFMYRHHPLTHTVEEIVTSGRLGQVRGFKGAFTFPLTRENDVRLDPALGGGSLWDVGCYPVSYSCLLAGDAPVEVFGWQQNAAASGPSSLNRDQIAERGARLARRDDRAYREYVREEQRRQAGCPAREVVLDQRGRATRIDLEFAGMLRFRDGSVAQFDSGFLGPFRAEMEVIGTSGALRIERPFRTDALSRLLLTVGDKTAPLPFPADTPFAGEIADMEAAALDGRPARVSLAESRRTVATITALYESARSGRLIHL